MKRARCTVVTLVILVWALPAHAATDPKAARTCRNEIASKIGKIIKTGVQVVMACHKARDKGKFSGNCNDLATADGTQKYAKALSAAAKSLDPAGKKCPLGNIVRGNYPSGDIVGGLTPPIQVAIESLSDAVLGSPSLQGNKAAGKCHGQLEAVITKVVDEIVKGAIKCQKAVDKTSTSFGELAGDCQLGPIKSGPKGDQALAKSCAGLTVADVDTCVPLLAASPATSCSVATATSSGEGLATAIYGQPTPGCHNGIQDPGEECDDGNTIDTDGCVGDCKLASCGDGFVHAGVELCGDTPAAACSTPDPTTCAPNLQPCGDDGTRQSVKVRFSKPGSLNITALQIALDYPEGKVGVPGFSNDQSVQDRVTNVAAPFFQVNDRDFEIEVDASAAPDTIPSGDYFTVQLDVCIGGGGVAALNEFGCVVRQAADDQNNLVTQQVGCSVAAP